MWNPTEIYRSLFNWRMREKRECLKSKEADKQLATYSLLSLNELGIA